MKKRYLVLPLVVLLCSCGKDPTSFLIKFNNGSSTHSILQDNQASYLNSSNYGDTTSFGGSAIKEQSFGKPYEITWNVEADSKKSPKSYEIKVSENESFDNGYVYSSSGNNNSYNLYNLKSNSKYYYQVSAIYDSTTFKSEIQSITTLPSKMRPIFVDGVNNFRDLGSSLIKEGLIYRSGKFNSDYLDNQTRLVSDKGIHEVVDVLKIKTEIDLRKTLDNENGGITCSPMGNSVSYYSKPLYYGGKNILSYTNESYNNPAMIKSILELMADQNNYPMVFHCSQGKDRTGCIAFLIKALMGETIEDIYRDYMFSNFSILGGGLCSNTGLRGYITLVNQQTGDTLQDKVSNYIKNVLGLEENKLNLIREILQHETN